MKTTYKLYLFFFAMLMVGLVGLELSKHEVIDWRKNFDAEKKTPFGLYIFDNEINEALNNQIKRIQESPYHYYERKKDSSAQNILIIAKDIDITSWEKIEKQVDEGSHLFLFSDEVPAFIHNKIELDNLYPDDETLQIRLTDKKLSHLQIHLDKRPGGTFIDSMEEDIEILGTLEITKNHTTPKHANFIRFRKGKGWVYLHLEPLFLTNYYLLKRENQKFAASVLSYFPNRETVWFVDDSSVAVSQSPMRVILSNPPLKYAWWIFLGGLVLFAFFTAKRKQRIVPIVTPLKNKSVEFVKSIGNLYLQEGDFHDMMAKKAQYFLYEIRTKLLIDVQNMDDNFAKRLHIKTGQPIEKIHEAISLIKKAQNPYAQVTQEDLQRMTRILDEIFPPLP